MIPRIPTDAALKNRSRTLIEKMTERQRWVYAIPQEEGEKHLAVVLKEAGFAEPSSGASLWVLGETARFRIRTPSDLGVTIVEASGEDTMEALASLLENTGFYAQSTLLHTAWDLQDEECTEALATLAPMVSVWDDEWLKLFEAHLTSENEEVAAQGVLALECALEAAGKDPRALALLTSAQDS